MSFMKIFDFLSNIEYKIRLSEQFSCFNNMFCINEIREDFHFCMSFTRDPTSGIAYKCIRVIHMTPSENSKWTSLWKW